jgi:hypothetical protein
MEKETVLSLITGMTEENQEGLSYFVQERDPVPLKCASKALLLQSVYLVLEYFDSLTVRLLKFCILTAIHVS